MDMPMGGGPGADDEAMAQMANMQQMTQLQDMQKQQALIQALRKYGGSEGGQKGDGSMVGKFYVPKPQNQVTDLLGAGASIAGGFGGGGGGGGAGGIASLFGG
jgi:hypothetical protein